MLYAVCAHQAAGTIIDNVVCSIFGGICDEQGGCRGGEIVLTDTLLELAFEPKQCTSLHLVTFISSQHYTRAQNSRHFGDQTCTWHIVCAVMGRGFAEQ
jgi:hypothetical protein